MRCQNHRLNRAKWLKQSLYLLKEFGYVCDTPTSVIDEGEWRTRFRRNLHRSLTTEQHGRNAVAMGTCAARAADIVKYGSESRWWHARLGNEPAGSDKRGVQNVLKHWLRRGKIGREVMWRL